ncbi:MAG TPA: phosphoglycerate dehydrogenase [Solirubrobacteraceae bacterium]|jgi:phosphoglycerate dehydrogenase-like enzyme
MAAPRRLVLTAASTEYCRDELQELPDVEVIERYDLADDSPEQPLADGLTGAWAVVAGGERYSPAVLQGATALRAIVRWGTGSDAIDLGAASQAGVAVVTTPGANADAVADMALSLMLASLRRLPGLDSAVRTGAWRPPGITRDLAEATVGILGLGAIGRAVARRVRGFRCRVIAVEPHPDRDFCAANGVELADLDEMLPHADVLTVHAPLTEGTRHIIGADEFALLPAHAVVINTSRGPLIDQHALVAALRHGVIAGAGLDVFEEEPLPDDDPLLTLPNVIVSGHASSFTHLAMRRTGAAVLASVRELLEDRLPAACLNPEAWTENGQ